MLLRCTETFFHGPVRVVPKGTILDSSDPAVKAAPFRFEEVKAAGPVVEQATAAPGEVRAVKPRTRKAKD